jgi:hypothetical protein
MLIHPADEEPTTFIGFREEIAFPINDDARARMTIEAVGLNREAMAEFRLDHLTPFKRLLQALPLLPPDSTEARDIQALFEQAVRPRAQYSSMIRSLLTGTL